MKSPLLLLAILLLVFLPTSVYPRTWYVKLDGTGDAPTIQAAVDSAQDGDEVLVAAGTYTWTNQSTPPRDSRCMVEVSVEVWLHSESGPEATIMDAEDQGRIMNIVNETVRIQPLIEGFTLRNGSKDFYPGGGAIICVYCDPTIKDNIIVDNWTMYYGGAIQLAESNATIEGNYFARNVTGAGWGGAICSWTDSNPIIIHNIFDDNHAKEGGAIYCYSSGGTIEANVITRNTTYDSGGGIYCYGASPTITNNVIAWNRARDESGGGIYCRYSSSEIVNNTLVGNRSSTGAGMYLENYSPTISKNIIADCQDGVAVYCDTASTPSITCNDFWDNAAGNGNCTLGADNFSADPMFCDEPGGNYHLHEDSACAPANSPEGCSLVGAMPVGCWDTPISGTSLAILAVALLAAGGWAIRRTQCRERT